MTGPLDYIRRTLQKAQIDDSMLYLAHLLSVIRGEISDPAIERRLSRLKTRPPEFLVHFIAKWLLLEAEEPSLYVIDWDRYKHLQDLYFQIDDPIVHDPAWIEAETSGFFERMYGHQIPIQERVTTRDIGLALALFRDCGTPKKLGEYDLKAELESELGVGIEYFIAMGSLAYCAKLATYQGIRVRGTLDSKYLQKAHREGIAWCTPEVWLPFLRRVVCTRDEFRNSRSRKGYQVEDPGYLQFEFNSLQRYPIIDIGYDRHIAVDPDLILKRVTRGLFFDMFERHGTHFSQRFGDIFSRLVGELLQSLHPSESLWFDAEDKASVEGKTRSNMRKRGDWAFKGAKYTILFECKSLQPSLELRHFGSQPTIDRLRERIVSGLEQVIRQGQAIQQGNWVDEGLPPAPVVCVLVSYGRFYAVKLPWFRDRIRKALEAKGLGGYPFAVLSIDEFDTVIRLAELGVSMDEFFFRASQEHGAAGVIRSLAAILVGKIVASSYAHSRHQDFEARFIPGSTGTFVNLEGAWVN